VDWEQLKVWKTDTRKKMSYNLSGQKGQEGGSASEGTPARVIVIRYVKQNGDTFSASEGRTEFKGKEAKGRSSTIVHWETEEKVASKKEKLGSKEGKGTRECNKRFWHPH